MRKRSKQSSSSNNSRQRSRDNKKDSDFSLFNNKNDDLRKKFREELLKTFNRESSPQSHDNQPRQVVKFSKQKEENNVVEKWKKIGDEKQLREEEEDSMDMFEDIEDCLEHNNPTDHESYFRVVNGEILFKKYKIVETLGKGVFGNVVKVVNIENEKEFAIKILRNNEMIMRSGEKQAEYLKKINSEYVIKCYETFMYKSHYCIVFELLGTDIRARISEKLFSLDEIKKYAIQLFIGLHALRKHKLVHADIKPDNLLFSTDKQTVKICDFGTAFTQDQASIIQYLVARYYRAPEIILGCNLNYSIDTWSIGCTLYQMVTGQFLFPGKDNNEVLKYIMKTRGKISLKMLRKGAFSEKHFDKNNNFIARRVDPITLQTVHKSTTITQDRQLLKLIKTKNTQDSKKQVLFKDFLERCLTLNPKNRLTPDEALKHPFLNHQLILN